jgi:2-keto-4-pentenoate hydratase/2-oxohepta-3-ene-1,7-dioic acid hydratase in catechol pathway
LDELLQRHSVLVYVSYGLVEHSTGKDITSASFEVRSELAMALVVYETGESSARVGIRIGSDIVPVDSLDCGDDVDGLTDWMKILDTLESEARGVVSDNPQSVEVLDVSRVSLHSPIHPSKIVRIEGSFEHDLTDEDYNPFIDTEGLRKRDWPRFWVAPMSAMARPPDQLILPRLANKAKPGVALALVIGSAGKNWSPEEGTEAISGCLVMADVGIYDPLPGQWGYRFFDSAMSFGTDLVPFGELDVTSLDITTELNGDTVDTQSTDSWRFSPGEMVSTVSETMSLQPGDVITTGDPMRIDGTLDSGDEVRATIENVGTVESSIRRERTDAEVLI